jgi:Ca2+-binding EF-hand superfamily protein
MNGISSLSGSMNMPQNMYGMRRPSPEEAAQQLFSELDTSGQGYIELSDLESAFQQVSSISSASNVDTDESDLEELFSQLDSDGDGKITEQEFTDSLAKIDQQMNELFAQMRMQEAMGNMPPPPPPPPANDEGFTAEELSAQLEEIGDSDSERSTLIQSILDNFDEADSDGDGKVNLEEAMAYGEANGLGPQVGVTNSGMMPPPPPPPENDEGFTAEELTAQLEEIGSSDSERASFIQNILDNFEEADADGDGKVTFEEAMAYNQSESEATSEVASSAIDNKVMMQIMQLLQAYNIGGPEEESSSILSVTA